MASSGIKLADGIEGIIQDFKKKRNYGFVLVLNDANNKIVLKEDSVLQDLPVKPWIDHHAQENNVCYFVVHYVYKTKDSNDMVRKGDEYAMLTWAPDSAPIKKKMLAASTKDAVKRGLEKHQLSNLLQVAASGKDELDIESLTKGLKDCKSLYDFDIHHGGENDPSCE